MKRLLPVLFVASALTLGTDTSAYSADKAPKPVPMGDGRNLDYGGTVYCKFVNLKIEGDMFGEPDLRNIKVPDILGGGTWDLSNLKLNAETVGDGRLDIEFETSSGSWYVRKVEGPRNAPRDYNKLLALLFYQKSSQPDYYKAIYEKNDVQPFLWGSPRDTEAGGKKFDIHLDNGTRVQLLASSHGFISFVAGKNKIHATGPCGPKTKNKESAASADIRSRLLRIKKLERKGLITKDEAARKRQELLDKL